MNRLVQQAALPQAVTAAYDVANELTTFNNPTPNLTYDANGNLTNDGTKTYIWNPRNQLVAISGGGVTASFVYDAVGRRVSKTINGARTDYQYDGNDIVAEIGGGSAVNATYIRTQNIDEPLARITSTGIEYYHADALGSIFALTDAYGNTTATYTYDPFGNTTQTGISTNPFQYTGREQDNTGLLYFRARYYSPQFARFIKQDPINSSPNQYAYADNTPTNGTDPFGLCTIQVRFKRVFANAYHAYILTKDQTNTMYFRGGPANNSLGKIASGSSGSSTQSCASKGNLNETGDPFGSIEVQYGAYRPGTPDYTTKAQPNIPILDNDLPCDTYNFALEQISQNINQSNISYSPWTTNSNATVTTLLSGIGLRAPPALPVWAPGWGTPLP